MFTNVTHRQAQDEAYYSMEGYSVSRWKLLPDHPEEFYGFHVADPPLWTIEPSEAMKFGTMVHARLLEPDSFNERFPESTPCCETLKSGKRAGGECGNPSGYRLSNGTWRCGVHAKGTDAQPVECLTSVDAVRLNSIVRAAYSDPKISLLLTTPGEVEYSLFGTHAETGLSVRGRLDKWLRLGEGLLIGDLKTCAHDPCNERLVAATCLQRGYHQQASAYLDMMEAHGMHADGFAFVFIRTAPPYNSCLWFLNDNDIELGRRRNRLALLDLAARLKSGDWTGPRHGKENFLAYPKWAYDDDTYLPDETPASLDEFAAYGEQL